jgi:hypothetical protein
MGIKTNAYRVLAGIQERKGALGKPGRRWERWRMEDVNRIHVAQCREQLRDFVNTVMNFGFYKILGIS